jgi:hypothetical protein
MISSLFLPDHGRIPRHLTAVGVGVLTGFFGTAVPLAGLGVGLLWQIANPAWVRNNVREPILEGLVDGSAALLGHNLISRQ